MNDRFLPSLSQVRAASEELPDPEIWPENEYSVPIEGSKKVHEVIFSRVKFASRSNGRTYRWVYDGKILIRSNKGSEKADS
ncbi:hypothetical protein [Rubellicoccus peritrichatus]|uniref:Uncharacterized protein n=1 Tax=Rubellicoccus peritrichatus TaxID=3080537 RepID=A0AAQ3QUD1_9BACT|nr:hypothetical protein [Puniceicoccus sp. CR14]WOO40353.1 hypothetical protein RZN69_17175 [Puniceicoccus sp. CR14]